MTLAEKIRTHQASVAVIGIGYVGLPLGVEIARTGFPTVGIDVDRSKVRAVNAGRSFIEDVPDSDVTEVVKSGRLRATTDYAACADCDVINICVPTPFTATKDPDVSYIVESGRLIARHLKRGDLVILRSTTYPETTEKVLLPVLETSGLKAGRNFHLAFAPERIDPGNKHFTTRTTPVVVGGLTQRCTKLARQFHEQFVSEVYPVSSPRAAEMSKLLENIFRSVNIALVNEMALMCERMGGIDIWEVVKAASSKPYGFMPFYPGPGIGGHCILIDPYYLSWKAREYDFHSNFIELAAQTNESMPYHVADRLLEVLGTNGIPASRARLLILGAAFKRDVEDTRHSPAIKVMEILTSKVKTIRYHDPHVPELAINGRCARSTPLTDAALRAADCVLILTDHSAFDYDRILLKGRLILDCRNAIKQRGPKKLYTLGDRSRR
ncbi:MAG TPA: nucleotide sugar dehydrogenase [candidate division WOR-3 bacterium]|uniref:Nucleotide sugar dehydrogenase n=1 Tax=candidate division WOR-3 bacterium TaxID=2052148 RepID=A0A7V0T7H0_UNCW3|nr:nucleotide sugar dehydrogenase [candidate division WOR-3 bacterium]